MSWLCLKGFEVGLPRLKETLAGCADPCRTPDSGIPELLAPLSFALLPFMMEGSSVPQTPKHLFQV